MALEPLGGSMRNRTTVVIVAALALAGCHGGADAPLARQEARLSEMLDGRVARAPVDCIPRSNGNAQLVVLDQIGIVYDAGDVIYLARISAPGTFRGADRVQFKAASRNTLCKGDEILAVDSGRNVQIGEVQLPKFVPYVKVRAT